MTLLCNFTVLSACTINCLLVMTANLFIYSKFQKKGLIEKDIYAGIQIRKNGGEPLSALLILSEMA